MQLILDGTPQEIADAICTLGGIADLQNFTERDEELEKELQKNYDNWVGSVKEMVHYSENKQSFMKISDMHPTHLINLMLKLLKEGMEDKQKPTDLFHNESFRSVVLNLAEKVEEEIVREKYENNATGRCFDDSINPPNNT